jgi:hypothetical protein
MSWSVSIVGKPAAVRRALDEHSNHKLTGQSKKEWDEAYPALRALVNGNMGDLLVNLAASGHASTNSDGVRTQGQLNAVLTTVYGFVE